MGMPGSTLVSLIQKVRSWISWGNSDSNSISSGVEITDKNSKAHCHCKESKLQSIKYHCQSCGRLLCGKCVHGVASFSVAAPNCLKDTMKAVVNIKTCNLCFNLGPISNQKCSGKVHPSESPTHSPEPTSPSSSGERFLDNLSPVSVHPSSSRYELDSFAKFTISCNPGHCLFQYIGSWSH